MFYVVRGLSPYTEYEFHVIGVNNIGRGPASAAVSTTTGETGLEKWKLNFKFCVGKFIQGKQIFVGKMNLWEGKTAF
jgi:hypothetical protein